jgi:hypothetical protein
VSDIGTPPEGIGPHEDRELELMLIGEKPLAMFGDALGSTYEFPEAKFAPYVADGTIIRREIVYRPEKAGVACRFVYFARPDEEWRIKAMHQINEKLFVRGEPASPEIERQIGRLLGYTEADIEQYIAWFEACRSTLR